MFKFAIEANDRRGEWNKTMQPLFFCKPKTLGHWAVGPLMIVAVCGVRFIAQAQPIDPYGDPKVIKGQWVAHYSIESGKGMGSTQSAPNGFVFNFATTDKGYYGEYESGEDPRGGSPSYGGASVDSGGKGGRVSASGQSSSAKVEGVNVKVTYKWESLYPGPYAQGAELEKPPAKLNFFLYGSATGYAYGGGGATNVFASADGKDSSDNSQTYKSAGATHLFSFETKGGTEFSGTMPLKAEASGSSSASAFFNFSTGIDSRSVSISSSTIEPSYFRSASQPYTKELHKPDSSGAKQTDSVVHLYDGLWQSQGIQFSANNVGNWNNPIFDWESTGDSGPAAGFRSLQEEQQSSLTTGFSLGPGKGSFPKSSTVKVIVTDADDAKGDNTFAIKWHLQYEKERDLPDGNKRKEISWIDSTHIPPGQGVGVHTTPARTLSAEAAINGVLLLADLGGVPGASELGQIFELVTNLSEWQMTEPTYSIASNDINNDGAMFKQVLLDNPENISNMTVAKRDILKQKTPDQLQLELSKYACFVGRVRFHKTKSYLADKYDSHGYASSGNLFTYDYTYPNGKEFQLFYQVGNQSPPPNEGDSEIPPSYNIS